MYYKIENKECEVYKKLHQMRIEELQIGKENIQAIEVKTGLKFKSYFGYSGQQNPRRTPQYSGFKFTEPEKVDLKIWQKHKDHIELFVPNRKTKAGREMSEFLMNGLKVSCYSEPLIILGLSHNGTFTLPFVEIFGEIILMYLDDKQEPKDSNVIEITKREFQQLSND